MAEQIVSDDLTLNSDILQRILTHKNVSKLKVAIISIAGPFRKGKSFLLNFFIRYLRRNCSPDWLTVDLDEDMQGFHWMEGADADTRGVWLWPEPFIVDDVAIF
uniref:GB1/RHD3-type G domain-containing protein n=1 Tax=Strigamia maritima TaxID=126957 RepID=T1IGX9_STRMM